MRRELFLSGAFANAGEAFSRDELLEFLGSEIPDLEFYKYKPKAGTIMAVGLDWIAIIGTTASIVTIGQVLWAAYQKFVKPIRQKDPNSRADIIIQIRTEEWKSEQFMIGESLKTEEEFIDELKKSIERLEQLPVNKGKLTQSKREFRVSKTWIRVKKSTE